MLIDQPLPALWLLSDERNDALLENALCSFREPIGFVYRHYHLRPEERLARYIQLERICRERRHLIILADSALTAKGWGADGIYGAPLALARRRARLLTIATAHDMREIAAANLMRASGVMVSPVFATRSRQIRSSWMYRASRSSGRRW
jgi:thiamine-phosphate pyrophosphorylase